MIKWEDIVIKKKDLFNKGMASAGVCRMNWHFNSWMWVLLGGLAVIAVTLMVASMGVK